MSKEFTKLPNEYSFPVEFEMHANKELCDAAPEFTKANEFDFDQEFNSNIVNTNVDDDYDSGSTDYSALKTKYTKALKIMKLATAVSLTAATTSVALPRIVPIITIDATEESSTNTTTKEEELVQEFAGDWSISNVRKVIVVDGEEVDDTTDNTSTYSYNIENDDGVLYLNTYDNNELINTTELTLNDDSTLSCHISKQSGEEVDILVYMDGEFLVIKETGQTTIENATYESITYNYCSKGKAEYVIDNNKKTEPTEPVVSEEICMECDGTGKIKCDVCDKTGVVECTECNGTGYLDSVCTACEGSGECITCKGTGMTESTSIDPLTNEEIISEETCPDCEGTGLCATCNGSGKEKCPTCNTGAEGSIPGYIKCSNCDGTGEVTCPKCEGTGKIEVTNEDSDVAENSVEETKEETTTKEEDTSENIDTQNETAE